MQNKISITLTGQTVFEIFDQMKTFMTGALLNPKAIKQDAFETAMTDPMPVFAFEKKEIESPNYDKDDADQETTAKDAADEPAPKKTRTRKTKAAVTASSASADPDLSGQEQPRNVLGSEKSEAPAVVVASKEAVQQALQQVNISLGLPEARRILSHFKINRISEIKPDQYKEFIEMCNKAAEQAPSETAMFS